MTTTTGDDLTTLRERRSSLADRLDDCKQQTIAVAEDVAVAETDFLDSIESGEDSHLLSQRLELRKSEQATVRRALDHLTTLLFGVNSQITDLTARAQLADDVQRYHEARIDYSADVLPGLPDALGNAVEVVGSVLTELIAEVEAARTSHDQLVATAGSLHHRAEQLGVAVDVPQPPGWSAGLEQTHHRDAVTRQLCLALLQRRGEAAVLAEVARVILLQRNADQRAAR